MKAGIVSDLDSFSLEPIPRNPERRDFQTRGSFRALSGSRIVCHLTVGANLEDIWKRSGEFAAACPEIAARPLFLHRAEGVDYLGVEFVEGTDFETLALQGQLKAPKASSLIRNLVSCLEGTFQESTVSAAQVEMDALFASIGESPMFSGLDQRFLQEFVFPLIRQGVCEAPPRTRWTNGDFIPCNVRIDLQGRPRLVDYEFACRTHFHGEDSLRWAFFSKGLPKEFRGIVPFDDTSYMGSTWLEAYFLLRQMKLSAETSANTMAISSTAAYVRDRLLNLVSAYHNGFQSSLFYNAMSARPAAGPVGFPIGMAQLYWSTEGNFSEEQSSRLQVPYEKETLLRFKLPRQSGPLHLRFDPIDATGLVHISALRVHLPQTGQELLAMNGQTGWQGLRVCSGLHRLKDTPEFNSLSWSTDPSLLLPVLDFGPTGQDVAVEVGIRFTPKLGDLPALLAPPEAAGAGRRPESPDENRDSTPKDTGAVLTELAAAGSRVAELRQSLAQLEEGERNVEVLEAKVAAMRSEFVAAERGFHEALQSRLRETDQLAASHRAYVESLHAQNDEIRRLEAVNRASGEALIELRDQLNAAQRWLGNLRNRALVRLSLAIHREKWPL